MFLLGLGEDRTGSLMSRVFILFFVASVTWLEGMKNVIIHEMFIAFSVWVSVHITALYSSSRGELFESDNVVLLWGFCFLHEPRAGLSIYGVPVNQKCFAE